MGNYRFPTKRVLVPKFEPLTIEPVKKPEEEVGLIQGRVPDSIQEWRVANSLWRIKRNFIYQYAVGPRGLRGSYEVDFYVENVPQWSPLEVQSDRWHIGEFGEGEKLRARIIERELGAKMIYVWIEELETQAESDATVKFALTHPQSGAI